MPGVDEDLTIASRIASISPSTAAETQAWIRRVGAAGRDIALLADGDPQVTPAPEVTQALIQALQDGRDRYGPAAGDPALREALAARMNRDVAGAPYGVDEILITQGGAFALFACLLTVVEPGAEVILFDPAWVSYAEQVRLCGGVPVRVPALTEIDVDAVAAAVTERTRAIIINSPVNPTGRVVTARELRGLVSLAERRRLWLIFDQAQADLVYPDAATPFAALQGREGARSRSFIIGSFSKAYGMTGWRMGWIAAPRLAAASILKLMQHTQFCAPGFIQAAALAALNLPQSWLDAQIACFQARRDRAVAKLNALPGLRCPIPDAAYYLFPQVPGDDWTVADRWLEQCGVAVMPGGVFGAAGKGHVRLSLGVADAVLDAALERLGRWGELAALTPTGVLH